MSSREIAELTGKRHDHVIRDIKVMLEDLGEAVFKFGGSYRGADGTLRPCFNLPKRETMILVSGYSVVLRARIVDRWMELEGAVLKFEGSYLGVNGPKFGGVYIDAKGEEFERSLLPQRSTGKNAFTPAIRKTCGPGPRSDRPSITRHIG